MKRGMALVLVLVMVMSGCKQQKDELSRGIVLREKFADSSGCSFIAEITSDFGDKTYTFTMLCQSDRDGAMNFTVREPDSIAGISGTVSQSGGKLTFDNAALAFELLADGDISPVSAPWLFLKALQSGYITSCGTEGENLRLTIDDTYEEDAMQVDIWLDADDVPIRAEIVWKGDRIVTILVGNFQFL